MALVPTPASQLSYNTDASEATFTDDTAYGGANPDRNEVAVYIEIWKVDSAGVTTVVELPNLDPDTADEWTFNSEIDGHYKVLMYIIENYSGGTAYVTDDVVYYSGLLYKAIQATTGNLPTNITYWELVEELSDTIEDGNNVLTTYKDYLVIEHGKKCAGDAAVDWSRDSDCGACGKLDLASKALQRRLMVIAAQRFATINLYNKAEAIARKLETACASC